MSERLRDGSRITIRPIEPDDREALAAAFERLSPQSRYRRFFAPMAHLSERDLDYLTRVDHHDHEALVATDAESGEGVGVARYVRTAPEVAEPAIAVVDDWQGRGVGACLIDALADRAREEGVRRFEAPVLAENDQALRLLERLGELTRRTATGREIELTIELPAGRGAGARWRTLLRHAAAGTVAPVRSVFGRLLPSRRGAPDDARRNVIVVGTDGSDHADRAVETAGELASASGASVDVVGAHRFATSDHARLSAVVQEAAAALRERGLHVHEHLRRGDPALVLTDVAAEQSARLVVVGAGERGKGARRLTGSVADVVAARSPCNVLIVRAEPRGPARPG